MVELLRAVKTERQAQQFVDANGITVRNAFVLMDSSDRIRAIFKRWAQQFYVCPVVVPAQYTHILDQFKMIRRVAPMTATKLNRHKTATSFAMDLAAGCIEDPLQLMRWTSHILDAFLQQFPGSSLRRLPTITQAAMTKEQFAVFSVLTRLHLMTSEAKMKHGLRWGVRDVCCFMEAGVPRRGGDPEMDTLELRKPEEMRFFASQLVARGAITQEQLQRSVYERDPRLMLQCIRATMLFSPVFAQLISTDVRNELTRVGEPMRKYLRCLYAAAKTAFTSVFQRSPTTPRELLWLSYRTWRVKHCELGAATDDIKAVSAAGEASVFSMLGHICRLLRHFFPPTYFSSDWDPATACALPDEAADAVPDDNNVGGWRDRLLQSEEEDESN